LIDRRRYSIVLDIRSFRGADCDIGLYLVVAKVRERLSVGKQITNKYYMEKFNLQELNAVEDKEQYRIEISNRFAALENLDENVDIKRAWDTIRENTKFSAKDSLGYYKMKTYKPWFDEGCSKPLGQMKRTKL
jgi:hypothetical protein